MKNKLINGLEGINPGHVLIICFPHAGGSASFYNSWKEYFDESYKICPIQLPGREEKFSEKPMEDMQVVVENVVNTLMEVGNKIILFGHSMGTKILYEVEKEMEKRGKNSKLAIVSACAEPQVSDKNPISHLTDEEFVAALNMYNGIPCELAANKELLNVFLPMLRSDFKLSEGYKCKEKKKLQCPILALSGDKDVEATREIMEKWKEYTENEFKCETYEGDHFYLKTNEAIVMEDIKKFIKERELV